MLAAPPGDGGAPRPEIAPPPQLRKPLPPPRPGPAGVIPEPVPTFAAPVPSPYDLNPPQMPPYAWPTYAPYNNFSRVAYPLNYPYQSWPYIGPCYPFPKIPPGWRSVKLEWEDGHWWFSRDRDRRWLLAAALLVIDRDDDPAASRGSRRAAGDVSFLRVLAATTGMRSPSGIRRPVNRAAKERSAAGAIAGRPVVSTFQDMDCSRFDEKLCQKKFGTSSRPIGAGVAFPLVPDAGCPQRRT